MASYGVQVEGSQTAEQINSFYYRLFSYRQTLDTLDSNAVLAPLVTAAGEREWAACVVNSRGCAMHKITSNVLYNARATWDCRQTVKWLRKTFPNRPLYGIGYSLGANILTNVSSSWSMCNKLY
jgi:hypothetical protein